MAVKPAIAICDMCGNREEFEETRRGWRFPDEWYRGWVAGTRFQLCPNDGCVSLFEKQCQAAGKAPKFEERRID